MSTMNDQSRALLTSAIEQAGTYRSGQKATIHFKGRFHGYDEIRGETFIRGHVRTMDVSLSSHQTQAVVKDISFDPIIEAWAPMLIEDIEEVEIHEITLGYVSSSEGKREDALYQSPLPPHYFSKERNSRQTDG